MENTPEKPLGVSFKVDLAPNGDIQRVHLTKDGSTISLTAEQAATLAAELPKRFVKRQAQNLAGALVDRFL